jgi:hypothetical protein
MVLGMQAAALSSQGELTRQCAWCLRVVGPDGRYGYEPWPKLIPATHGICPSCVEVLRADIDSLAA